MNSRNVWPTVVLAIASALIVAGMAIAKVDKDTISLVAGVLILPVLAALLAAQGASNASAIQSVQQQTNGNQARMLDVVERLGHLLAAATPPAPAPDPVEPTSTQPPTGGTP